MIKKQTKKIKFADNAPVDSQKDYGTYTDILQSKISNKDIKNIGIIAPYGSGKSSFIKTFINKYYHSKIWKRTKKTILSISLANFNSSKKKIFKR